MFGGQKGDRCKHRGETEEGGLKMRMGEAAVDRLWLVKSTGKRGGRIVQNLNRKTIPVIVSEVGGDLVQMTGEKGDFGHNILDGLGRLQDDI